jgi:hypothetical protein
MENAQAPFKGQRASMSDKRAVNNAIGFPSGSATGGSFPILPPTTTTVDQGVITADFSDPAQQAALKQQQADAYAAEMNSRYDGLLNMSNPKSNGFFVSSDGSIFQGTPDNGMTYLAIDWIQNIENSRGTAGTLLMHFNEPAIAKDTAGYEGGSSGTFQQSGGVDNPTPPTQPIPEVTALPPVTKTDSGTTVFVDSGTTTPPATTTTTTADQSMLGSMGFQKWWLWIIAAIIISIIYIQYHKK